MDLVLGDCLEVMAEMQPDSVDAIVTDPPYGLGFMGKKWDAMPPGDEVAAAMLRVLKPAHYLLAFGGTRTHHRLMVALEDAGFEIRDCLMWLYGSGFPKGKGQLKPAYEPIILCRKPGGKVRALGIDECRIGADGGTMKGTFPKGKSNGVYGDGINGACEIVQLASGRWPANIVLDEEAASEAGAWSRYFYTTKASRSERNAGLDSIEIVLVEWKSWDGVDHKVQLRVDTEALPPRVTVESGTHQSFATAWSTFLFGSSPTVPSPLVSKSITATKTSSTTDSKTLSWLTRSLTSANTVVVNFATENGGSPVANVELGTPSLTITCDGTVSLPGVDPALSPTRLTIKGNAGSPASHPTVKPVALMRWLVRLITPPGGIVLDPFMGSGTTGVAAVQEGRFFVGIELDPEYHRIAQARIAHAEQRQMEMAV